MQEVFEDVQLDVGWADCQNKFDHPSWEKIYLKHNLCEALTSTAHQTQRLFLQGRSVIQRQRHLRKKLHLETSHTRHTSSVASGGRAGPHSLRVYQVQWGQAHSCTTKGASFILCEALTSTAHQTQRLFLQGRSVIQRQRHLRKKLHLETSKPQSVNDCWQRPIYGSQELSMRTQEGLKKTASAEKEGVLQT